LVFWKLIGIFFTEFDRLVSSGALVQWSFAVFTFIILGVDIVILPSVSFGDLTSNAHALVCDTVSLVLLLSEVHDTTKSFVVTLEDSKVVVRVVLISILDDSFERILSFHLLIRVFFFGKIISIMKLLDEHSILALYRNCFNIVKIFSNILM